MIISCPDHDRVPFNTPAVGCALDDARTTALLNAAKESAQQNLQKTEPLSAVSFSSYREHVFPELFIEILWPDATVLSQEVYIPGNVHAMKKFNHVKFIDFECSKAQNLKLYMNQL